MRRTALMLALTLALAIAMGFIGEQIVNAQQVPDPRVADLVQAGRVRVGLALLRTFATKDPGTGELRGVAIDLARALATRLGVEVLPVEYSGVARVLEGLKDGAWDVAFLAVDPARAAVADFSHPYMQIDDTYLVPAGSSIRNVTDANQPGVRIAVERGATTDLVLSRMLKRAELVRADAMAAAFDLLRAGKANVLAGPRAALLGLSARLAGSRVLEDRFGVILYAMLVPKGHAGRLAYISDFIEEAKASGLVQRAIERAGLRGVQVAPAGNPSTR
ncbi:MAG: transporter substrate-binding domain-containing protein [Deltaproteobacteria bacterium]|nr:transporter substrate-binding domain-containing protein [Deltaproteobacteria bacterium]